MPQKQPPANTADSFPECDASGTSVEGGGIGGLGAAKQVEIASDNPTATRGKEIEKVMLRPLNPRYARNQLFRSSVMS
jgi:hypothetical protein